MFVHMLNRKFELEVSNIEKAIMHWGTRGWDRSDLFMILSPALAIHCFYRYIADLKNQIWHSPGIERESVINLEFNMEYTLELHKADGYRGLLHHIPYFGHEVLTYEDDDWIIFSHEEYAQRVVRQGLSALSLDWMFFNNPHGLAYMKESDYKEHADESGV